MATATIPARVTRRPPSPSLLGIPLLGLVAIEFLLGMALNLYVTLPTGSAGSILASSPLLIVHVVVGVLLLGLLGRVLLLGVRQHDRPTVLSGVLGLVSGVAAFVAGLAFAFGGGSAGASYVMSVGFVGMLVSAGILLRPRPPPAPGPSVGTLGDGRGSGSLGGP